MEETLSKKRSNKHNQSNKQNRSNPKRSNKPNRSNNPKRSNKPNRSKKKNIPTYLSITQHNIGELEINSSPELLVFDDSEYYEESNRVKLRKSIYFKRNIYNYLSYKLHNTCILDDLYTLQEVQIPEDVLNPTNLQVDPVQSFSEIINNYSYVYKKTGFKFYLPEICNSDITSYKEDHGCAIVYNNQRLKQFRIPNTLDLINEQSQILKTRSTGWLFLQDKITGKKYAIISVHGKIIAPIGFPKLLNPYHHVNSKYFREDRLIKGPYDFSKGKHLEAIEIYNTLASNIEEIKSKIKHIHIVLGGDFNINLLRPNFNPYNEELNTYLRHHDPDKGHDQNHIYEKVITDVFESISNLINTTNQYMNPVIIQNGTNLIGNPSYPEQLDFIFTDNNLNIYLDSINYDHNYSYYLVDEMKSRGITINTNLIYDFDHSAINRKVY